MFSVKNKDICTCLIVTLLGLSTEYCKAGQIMAKISQWRTSSDTAGATAQQSKNLKQSVKEVKEPFADRPVIRLSTVSNRGNVCTGQLIFEDEIYAVGSIIVVTPQKNRMAYTITYCAGIFAGKITQKFLVISHLQDTLVQVNSGQYGIDFSRVSELKTGMNGCVFLPLEIVKMIQDLVNEINLLIG